MRRSSCATRHKALPCVLAFTMAVFFCAPWQAAGVSAANDSLVLKVALDSESLPKLTATLSHKAARFSSTVKSSTEGTHEFKLEAKMAEDISHLRQSATLSISGLLAAQGDASCWRQLSSTTGVVVDRKASPWRPEGKLSITVREYPLNAARDYSEGTVRVKAGRTWSQPYAVALKAEATAGHKEMPGNPKWTANYWESSATAQSPLGSECKGSITVSAKGRAYPEAEHKSYTRASCKLEGVWTPSKVHSIDCSLTAAATVREKDRSCDKTDTAISARWSIEPSRHWSADIKGSLSSSIEPNRADAGRPVRATGGVTLTCVPADIWRLTAAGDLSLGHTLGDNEEGDEEIVGIQSEQSSKLKMGLSFAAKLGPVNGVTLDGKLNLKRESEHAKDRWEHSTWAPSAEIQASMKF